MKIIVFCLNIAYFFFKLLPVGNKVVFISRQGNKPSSDFLALAEQMKKDDPEVKTVLLCRTLGDGIANMVKYIPHMLVQMFHLATSKACVLDSYSIAVSCLKHKPSLKVLQIWHGLGAFKKFAFSIIGKEEGSSRELAEGMHMHENYTAVICSSEYCRPFFAEAFNVDPKKVLIAPLPIVDMLKSKSFVEETRARILAKHPELAGKKNILYAPTFRKNDETELQDMLNRLINCVDYQNYNLIVSVHPLSKLQLDDPRIVVDRTFMSREYACVADYAVTDYSASIYEFGILDKKIYRFIFDIDEYDKGRGFYLDLKDLPGPGLRTPEELIASIERDNYDLAKVRQFTRQFIDLNIENNTEHICSIIRNL